MSAIYIASKTAHGARWRKLRAAGTPIISTWIDEAEQGATSDWPDLWSRCITEASTASALIVYREPSEVLKGAWVEVGAALAAGKPVFAVGCEEFSVRHHPGIRMVSTLEDALALAQADYDKRKCAALTQSGAGEPVKALPKWVYTSALAMFDGDTNRVRAYHGSIHAGWEETPEFPTAEEFYAWAKTECDRRNAVIARLSALTPSGAGEPVVKALVWRGYPNSFPGLIWSAQTGFGFFNIEEVSASDCPAYEVRLHAHLVAVKDSLDEAKAAAQADYERRIRSALTSGDEPAQEGTR